MIEMVNRELVVSGRVQGVGFRWSTLQLAKRLGLSGWVQNQINGTVRIRVQGTEKAVTEFTKVVKSGLTPYARVDRCRVKDRPVESYDGFSIR